MSAPARFWPRYAAWSLDATLVVVVLAPFLWGRVSRDLHALEASFVLVLDRLYGAVGRQLEAGAAPDAFGLLQDASIEHAVSTLQAAVLRATLFPVVVFAVAMLVWQVVGERSQWQGSLGKRALHLRVVDDEGGQPALARSIGRQLAGVLSWLTLNIGHAMAAIPPAHLALHDRLSGTRVVQDDTPFPSWARGWIVLQAGIFAALTLAMTGRLASLAQAAVERAIG